MRGPLSTCVQGWAAPLPWVFLPLPGAFSSQQISPALPPPGCPLPPVHLSEGCSGCQGQGEGQGPWLVAPPWLKGWGWPQL